MGIISFPTITRGMTPDQLGDVLARVIKDIQYVMDGNISSTNVREIAGYKVGIDELKHKSGIVGMNGGDPLNPNAIRFWAGNANPAIAPFRVTQGGILTAVGAQFQSSTGYPRVEINSTNNLIVAYSSANSYVALSPTSGGAPSISWVSGGVLSGSILSLAGLFEVLSFNGAPMLLQSDANMRIATNSAHINLDPTTDLRINGTSGVSGTVFVSATNGGPTNVPLSFTKGIRTP